MKRYLFLVISSIGALSSTAWGWGQHYLVTDRLLQAESPKLLDELLATESLESFLKAEAAIVAQTFAAHADEFEKGAAKRFKRIPFDHLHPTRESFLESARLNPETQFPIVRRVLPGEKPNFKLVPFVSFSPIEKGTPPFEYVFEDSAGQKMTARSVLITYVDEPDWLMDLNLWRHAQYGYGKVPYGAEEGSTSKAPFHIQYLHENWIVRSFAPEITEGMVFERIALFDRLARAALKTGHRYWAFRFAAWALHYIEDAGQPYHARAVPFGDWNYYLKFIFSIDKATIKKETTQLVKNRHYAYEDFVAFGLQRSYLEDRPLFSELSRSLWQGEAIYTDVRTLSEILNRVTSRAALHAPSIDRAVTVAFGSRRTEDPTYDLETDGTYRVDAAVDAMNSDVTRILLEETKRDFENTGRGARTLLRKILSGK